MRIISSYAQKNHQTSVLRQQKRRNRGWTVVAVSLLVISFSLFHVMTNRNWYLLQHVKIVGANHLGDQQILKALNLRLGSDNLQDLPQDKIIEALKDQFVYVLDAQVTKELMEGILTIQITERTPSVQLVYGGSSGEVSRRLADLEGAVLSAATEEDVPDLAVVEISSEHAPSPGTRLTSGSALSGLEVVRIVRHRFPALGQRLVSICPDDASKIKLKLKDGAEVWLAATRIEDGLLNLSVLLENTDIDLRTVAYIDARFQGMIYCGG